MTKIAKASRWKFSQKTLRESNPLEGGSRYTFFVQLILARAAGAVKSDRHKDFDAYLKDKIKIDLNEFEKTKGLSSMTREASRVWCHLQAQFKKDPAYAMERILRASKGQLSYLIYATRVDIGGRLDEVCELIETLPTRKFCKVISSRHARKPKFMPALRTKHRRKAR